MAAEAEAADHIEECVGRGGGEEGGGRGGAGGRREGGEPPEDRSARGGDGERARV